MKNTLILSTFLALFIFPLRAQISVDPETLDYGNVLMGNSPTLSFTITATLEQTVTITPPSFYAVDINSVDMTPGMEQVVNVTFTPSVIGIYDSFVSVIGSVFGSASVTVLATAVNDIGGYLTGTITADYSPYTISEDIAVLEGETLIIEPGVELIFEDDYAFQVGGTLVAEGDPDNLIILRSTDENTKWKGLKFLNSTSSMQYCIVRDVENDGSEFATTSFGFLENDFSYFESFEDYTTEYYMNCSGHSLSDETYVDMYWTENHCYHNMNSDYLYVYNSQNIYLEFLTPIIPDESTSISLYYNLYTSNTSYYQYRKIYLQYKSIENYYNGSDPNSNWSTFWETSDASEYYTNGDHDISIILSNESEITLNEPIMVRIRLYTSNNYSPYIRLYDFGLDGSFVYDNVITSATDIITSNVEVKNSMWINNTASNAMILEGSYTFKNLVFYDNSSYSVQSANGSAAFINSIITGGYDLDNCINCYNSDPIFIDDLGHLDPDFSPCIDAGYPSDYDACMPPGLGTSAADIGMYGGMDNCGTAQSNLPAGLPEIVNIGDIPDDQGGYVGIQYHASVFDYEHDAYNITHYSFWREMDLEGRSDTEFNTNPNGSHYVRDEEFWEWVGDMDAQGFENYGYMAPTVADSSVNIGMFWSKYIVIARTENDNIYFTSEPDSGYSVDNLAPVPPQMLNSDLSDESLTVTWDDEWNTDLHYWQVFKNDELLLELSENEFSDVLPFGEFGAYTVRGVDVQGNIGENSSIIEFLNGILGDATWNEIIDVSDIVRVAYMIMNEGEEFTLGELWSANLNADEHINVQDVVILSDIIMNGGLSNVYTGTGDVTIIQAGGQLFLSSGDVSIAGLQIQLSQPADVNNLTGLSTVSENGTVLMFAMTTDILSGQNVPVLNLPEGVEVESVMAVNTNGESMGVSVDQVLSVDEIGPQIPGRYMVHQNYPNPFNPTTVLQVDVPLEMDLQIDVYDLSGRKISELFSGIIQPGYHHFTWDGRFSSGMGAPSGMYMMHVQTEQNNDVIKSILLR